MCDERYSAAVDGDGIGLGSHRVRGLNGSVLRVLRVERIHLDFHGGGT